MVKEKVKKALTRYSSMSVAVKAAFWYTVCNVLQKGVSLLTVPFFTRLLTTEQYGVYSIYISWFNILSIFTSLNLYYGVFNKAMVKYEDDRDRYISSMQGLVILIESVTFVIYYFFKNQVNEALGLSSTLMYLMFVEMLFTPMVQFWTGRQRFEYKYRSVIGVSIFLMIANPVLGLIFVLNTPFKTEGRILGSVIVELVVGLVLTIRQFGRSRTFIEKKYWKYAVFFNLPLIPHYLSSMILNQGDRIVIEQLSGPTDVALYSVAYNIAILSQLFTNAISQAITPWLYSCLKDKKYDSVNKRLRPLMVIVASCTFLLMLFAPELIWIIGSEKYAVAVYTIPPIAASVFFIYLYNVYANFEFYYEKRIFITIASSIAAVLNIVLNYIFVPIYGYVAAGYTTLFCYFIYAFAHYIFSMKICEKNNVDKSVFSLKDIVIASVLVIGLTVVTNFLYQATTLRIAFIIILGVIVVIYRKKIIGLIKNS